MNIKQIAFAALTLLYSMNSSANLIENGSFEDPGLNPGSWSVFQTGIPGWTVQNGAGIEIQNNTIIDAYDGDQYVELDSHNNSSMWQLVDDLTIGAHYNLSFAYAPRVSSSFDRVSGPTINTNGINVYFGSLGELFNIDGVYTDNQNGWLIFSSSVVATSEEMYLTFEADGTSDSYGGFIDNVVLVPEPSIVALFGLGLIGMGVATRNRKLLT